MGQQRKPILIVEDETPVRSLLKVMLTEEGFEVVEAKDGTVALHELWKRRGSVAMLVTDIDMGRMGGIELAQSVRAQYPELPILFVSGLPMPPEEVERIVPGSVLVTKPFDVATLVAAVRKLA
jgi:two-component system KDP operon response regulator KdpE